MTTKPVSYQDIFDDISFQDADDSRSVLSPAAYLADLLFLKDDIGQDDAIDIRRPDIKTDILLNRENTYKTVPYLSIANKVMTNYLAHNGSVDKQLQFSPYPFNAPYSLPFNEATEVSRKGVETRDSSMHELYMKFAKTPNATIAARELLGLSQEEFSFIAYDCGPGSGKYSRADEAKYAAYVRKMWGMGVGDTFQEMSKLDTFLEYAMMSEKELKSILYQNCNKDELEGNDQPKVEPIPAKNIYGGFFINNGLDGGYNIHIDESNSYEIIDEDGQTHTVILETGRTSDMYIPGDYLSIEDVETPDGETERMVRVINKLNKTGDIPTPDYFDRFHRFVRLAKALGWTYEDLDTVLMAVCGGTLNENTITYVAIVNEMHKTTKKPIDELTVLFNSIKNFGHGKEKEAAHLYNRLFNLGDESEISKLTDEALKLRLMSSLKLDREMLDFAISKTSSLAGGNLDNDLAKLFRLVNFAQILKLNVKEVEVLLTIIQTSMEFFVDRHTFALDMPYDKPQSVTLFDVLIAANSVDRGSSLWIIQTAMEVVSWMKTCNITLKQLHFMVHGKAVGETIQGVFSQEQILVLISQWKEQFDKLLLAETGFVSEIVTPALSKVLYSTFQAHGVVAANGLVLREINDDEAKTYLLGLLSANVPSNEIVEKEVATLVDFITTASQNQKDAFYLSLQNQFGLTHQTIKVVAENVCKNPSESETDMINNLIAPVFTYMAAGDDELLKKDPLAEVNDFYTILQQFLMMVGKMDLSEREVVALFKTLNLREVTIGDEDKVPALSNADYLRLKEDAKSPLLEGNFDTVFNTPNGKIVAIKGGGYSLFNDIDSNPIVRTDFTHFTADTDLATLPGTFVMPVKAAATTPGNAPILFDSANNSWIWSGGIWQKMDYSHLENPMAQDGRVDAAFEENGAMFLFNGNYVYKYASAASTGQVEAGYPKKVDEDEIFKDMVAGVDLGSGVIAAYKVHDKLHLHLDNANGSMLIGESNINGTYSKVLETTTKDSIATVKSFLRDGGHVVTAFIGSLNGNPKALYVFVQKEKDVQVYRYSDPSAAFSDGSHCDEGYPKILRSHGNSEFAGIYAENKAPFKLSTAVTVQVSPTEEKSYLFGGTEYVASDDIADRNPITDLWKDNSADSEITTMQAGFVSDHGWTYLIANTSTGSKTYRYNSSDYSSTYDAAPLITKDFWKLAEGDVVDAAFMVAANPKVSSADQKACILFTTATNERKYALYTMRTDGGYDTTNEPSIGSLETFHQLAGGYPNLSKLEKIVAIYSDIENGIMTFHIFYKNGDTVKELIHPATGDSVEKPLDPAFSDVLPPEHINAVFKGVDTVYYCSTTRFTYHSYNEENELTLATPIDNHSFWGKKGIRPGVRAFSTIERSFTDNGYYYFFNETEYIKAQYDATGGYDGFVAADGYPKTISEFASEGSTIDISSAYEIVKTDTGYVKFTDSLHAQKFMKYVGQGYQERFVSEMSKEKNDFKKEHATNMDWAFSTNNYVYLFSGEQYVRYSNYNALHEEKAFYCDEGYPRAFDRAGFSDTENIDIVFGEVSNSEVQKVLVTQDEPSTIIRFNDNASNKLAYGTLYKGYTPGDIKSAIYDDGKLFMFTEETCLYSDDITVPNATRSSLAELTAIWRVPNLEEAPKLFDTGCDWAIEINNEMHYKKEYLEYNADGQSAITFVEPDCTADYQIHGFHKEKVIFYKEMVIREVEIRDKKYFLVDPITTLYGGFPSVSHISNVCRAGEALYFISDELYVRVDSTPKAGPLSEIWRLRDDIDGLTLVDLDMIKKFKMLSSQFDKTDNSILDYFKNPTRSDDELDRVTGWFEGDANKDISSKIYDGPISDLYRVSKLADLYNYAERFNVSPCELFEKGWENCLYSSLDSDFEDYFEVGGYVLKEPIVYSSSITYDDTNRSLASSVLTNMVRSTIDRKDRDEYVADFDRVLNSRKRDALVGLSLVKLGRDPNRATAGKLPNPATIRDLYGHLLTDIMMSEDSEVSKIKEAILAMQLYYHRFLMGLEAEGNDSHEGFFEDELKQWWEWMKNYRVWEANRKVFIYPENYIRPELRDNKSPEFEELEKALLEGELSHGAAVQAYSDYLEGFNTVSQLEVVGGFLYHSDSQNTDSYPDKAMMVGRTRTAPRTFFYNMGAIGNKGISWNTWHKIDVTVNSDKVIPVFAYDRKYIFWLEHKPAKMDVIVQDGDVMDDPEMLFAPIIYYSYLKMDGSWTAPQEVINGMDAFNHLDNNQLKNLFNDENKKNHVFSSVVATETNSLKSKIVIRLTISDESKEVALTEFNTVDDDISLSEFHDYNEEIIEDIPSELGVVGKVELPFRWNAYPLNRAIQPWYSFQVKECSFLTFPESVFLQDESNVNEGGFYLKSYLNYEQEGAVGFKYNDDLIILNKFGDLFKVNFTELSIINVYELDDHPLRSLKIEPFPDGQNFDSVYFNVHDNSLTVNSGGIKRRYQKSDYGWEFVESAQVFEDRHGVASIYDDLLCIKRNKNAISWLDDFFIKDKSTGKYYNAEILSGIDVGLRKVAGSHAFSLVKFGDFSVQIYTDTDENVTVIKLYKGKLFLNSGYSNHYMVQRLSTQSCATFSRLICGINNIGALLTFNTQNTTMEFPKYQDVFNNTENDDGIYNPPFEGRGTELNPYKISDKKLLRLLSQSPGLWDKHFIQTENITFENSDSPLSPIGKPWSGYDLRFKGVYDGNNHWIRNLKVDGEKEFASGLFGNTSHATIKNLNIDTIHVNGITFVGGLAGHLGTDSTVENCTIKNGIIEKIEGNKDSSCIGGLIGHHSQSCLISKSQFNGEIKCINGEKEKIGGLIGYSSQSTIKACSSVAKITVTTSEIDSSETYIGGMIGLISSKSLVESCYSKGSILNIIGEDKRSCGGLVGYAGKNVTISQCYSSTEMTTNAFFKGGLVGNSNADSDIVKYSYWDEDTTNQSTSASGGTPKKTNEMFSEGTFINWDFSLLWEIAPNNYPIHQWEGIPSKIIYGQKILTKSDDRLDYHGAMKNYYWEIFFHIPYLVANRFNEQKRYSDAKKWFEYVFNPIKPIDSVEPQSYWVFSQFREAQEKWDQSIEKVSENMLIEDNDQMVTYYNDPFDPHAIANLRPVAYRKAFAMSYIDNLIDWGDNLFRQYTRESINEAVMLYMLAYDLLGVKPVSTGEMELEDDKKFEEVEASKSYRLLDIENAPINDETEEEPILEIIKTPNDSLTVTDYFYMPENTNFIKYWDRVEDRVFKVRNGQNIDGVKVPLPLFQPPIDPMALVNAKAGGASLSEALGSLNISVPHYRYGFMVSKAKELAGRVNQLGGSLLSTFEKKDAEELSVLRNYHEKQLLDVSMEIREAQLEDRLTAKETLNINRGNAQKRYDHYNTLVEDGLNNEEKVAYKLMKVNAVAKTIANGIQLGAAIAAYTPNVGSPFAMTYGGEEISRGLTQTAAAGLLVGDHAMMMSNIASHTASNKRREQEWEFQRDLAEKEIASIDEQLKGADIQIEVAKKEIRQAEFQRKHNESVDLFMTTKFTNKELYQWMSSKLSGLFYQTYQMALDLAKQAQQSFRFELGLKEDEVNYLTSYYWDSQKKGLLAGEVLMADLDRMDKGYMEKNSRRFEISKSVSLLDIAPEAVLELKGNKRCNFMLSEKLFALDFPSHYGRQIKSISVTIPAVVGPYQNVNASLTQQSHYTLLEPDAETAKLVLDGDMEKALGSVNIRADWRGQQQIAVSRGVNDSGMFQLNFNDERYLPFEGTGAFSTWQLELTGHSGSFDVNTISDVIINVEYTALQGGESYGSEVAAKLSENTYREQIIFDVPQYFSTEWNAYKENPEKPLEVILTKDMFPGLQTSGEAPRLTVINPGGTQTPPMDIVQDLTNGVQVFLDEVPGDALIFIVDYDMKYQF